MAGKREEKLKAYAAEAARRLLGAYLSELEELGGREFKDPGFLAWSLAEYARQAGAPGLFAELERRAEDGWLGRAPGFRAETSPTFYYALAVDSLVRY